MPMQTNRGTKRVCQSATCALPFYDLNRADISCPNCGTVFDATVVLHPRGNQTGAGSWRSGRRSAFHAAPLPVAEYKPAPKPEEDEEAGSASDDVIDADTDTLPLEDDADDEIADVIIPPEDDQADR